MTFSRYWDGINGDFKINPDGKFTYTNRNCDVKCTFNGTPCVDYTLYEVSDGYVKEKFWIIVYYAK